MAIGTKCRSVSAGSFDWDRSSVCCPLIQQIHDGGLLVRNKREMFCVSLSIKARAVIQYIYLPVDAYVPPSATQSPGGILYHAASP